MDNYFHKGKTAQKPKKCEETVNSGNVLTRWLRDLRPTRDPKVTLPLGRTQSTSGKERRAKVTRTLSAGHRPRRETVSDPANRYRTYNEKFVREHTNDEKRRVVASICSDEQVENFFSEPVRERTFSDGQIARADESFGVKIAVRDRFKVAEECFGVAYGVYENIAAVNPNAKVSYLDEEGLRAPDETDAEDESVWPAIPESGETPTHDEVIMPSPAPQHNGKSPPVVHALSKPEAASNNSPDRADYTKLEYLQYKAHEHTKKNYHGSPAHVYENLPPETAKNRWEDPEDVVPARDPASLKSIRYGPGHEKYPSWPGETQPQLNATGPHRSHSWTQQTNYPKERPQGYARPSQKRPNPVYTQQLKTVMERCEKISPESRRYLPCVDRDGNTLGDKQYMSPSPPERDKSPLADKYYTKMGHGDYATPYEDMPQHHLTQADLEEYTRQDDSIKVMHQHQGSYAQSEGYHSYVSSSEITTTPFLDRLRQDSEAMSQSWQGSDIAHWDPQRQQGKWDPRATDGRGQWSETRGDDEAKSQQWDEESRAGRDSVVTTSSGSVSSSETLKCHGSLSDVSVASSGRSKQLIAHSARVAQPQRHQSESVLYLNPNSCQDRSQLKLFPVSTYTVQPSLPSTAISPSSQPQFSVADRISELERQQRGQHPSRQPDPNLRATQKKALLSFYERHQHSSGPGLPSAKSRDSWKSEPQLAHRDGVAVWGAAPAPPPKSLHSGDESWGSSHSSSLGNLNGPVIIGSAISIDDWVPERPPKKTLLKPLPTPSPEVPVRAPSPDLPPPPPPPHADVEPPQYVDDPLPPPPEAEWLLATAVPRRSTPGPASPNDTVPLSQVQGTIGGTCDREVLGTIGQPEEIQYDAGAINAILECNRGAKDLQRRRGRKPREELLNSSRTSLDQCSNVRRLPDGPPVAAPQTPSPRILTDHSAVPSAPRSHIENRPPLPLPRDAQPNDLNDFEWFSQYEKSRKQRKSLAQALESAPTNMFVRGTSKDTSVRASIKQLKNEMVSRMSLRFPKKEASMQRTVDSITAMQKSVHIPDDRPSFGMQRSISVSNTHPDIKNYNKDLVMQRSISVTNHHTNISDVPYVSDAQKSVPQHSTTNLRGVGTCVIPQRAIFNSSSELPSKSSLQYNRNDSILSEQLAKSVQKPTAVQHGVNSSQSNECHPYQSSDVRARNITRSDPGMQRSVSSDAGATGQRCIIEAAPVMLRSISVFNASASPQRAVVSSVEEQKAELCDQSVGKTPIAKSNRAKNILGQTSSDVKSELELSDDPPPLGPKLSRLLARSGAIQKTADYHEKLPARDRAAPLSLFGRRMSDEFPEKDITPAITQRSNSKAAYLAVQREKELGINNYEGSYKLTMSPSGESIQPLEKQLEMVKLKDKSSENVVLDNRLPLEPPDLIPKLSSLNQKSSSLQNVNAPPEYDQQKSNNYERYRLLPTAFNPRIGSTRLGVTEIDSITEDPVEVEPKSEPDSRSRLPEHQEIRMVQITTESDDMNKDAKPMEVVKEKTYPLDDRGDLSPPDVTRTRRLVERSTSFGRADTMALVDVEVDADVDGDDAGIGLSDAASQTDLAEPDDEQEDDGVDVQDESHADDLEVERLSRDLASQLSPSDKLLSLLVPMAERKRPTDYVAGLFRLESTPRRRPLRKHKTGSCVSNASSTSACSSASSTSVTSTASVVSTASSSDNNPLDLNKPEPVPPLPSSSPYFTTSESKAKLLTRYPSVADSLPSLPFIDSDQLKQKKEELMQRLDKKLTILRAEQLSLSEESSLNEELGMTVASHVARVTRPPEASKYRLHVEEVGKITSLLLGLSGRLARAENALFALPKDHQERKIHEDKRDKLREQLMEAKLLKESIDRRSEAVSKTLSKYLSEEDLADYLHFIHMKEKLIVDAREVADKIALGEEQLAALNDPNGTTWQ